MAARGGAEAPVRLPGGAELPAGIPAAAGGPGGGGLGGFGGQAGLTRLFNAEIGGQISWLLPAALVLLVAGLWLTRRAPAHRPGPGGAAAVGRLDGGHRAGVHR